MTRVAGGCHTCKVPILVRTSDEDNPDVALAVPEPCAADRRSRPSNRDVTKVGICCGHSVAGQGAGSTNRVRLHKGPRRGIGAGRER